jgi:predicted metal-dependent hydrolase
VSDLVIRRLLVDLKTPIDRHWNGGDAFRTALFNALSFSFPAGEQFFIDSVRQGVQMLSESQRTAFEAEVHGFIGQEATHRRIHAQFNEHLLRQGLVNTWELRIRRRLRRLEGVTPRAWLGATAATEHLTAILAAHLLAPRCTALEGSEPRLLDLWHWHASEELEHRSTAFDLFRAAGGSERWRRRLFFVVSFHFTSDLLRQTVANLRCDGTLWRWSTWLSAARTLFGRDGMVRACVRPWRRYLSASFHPRQDDGSAGKRWLDDHAALAPPVAAAAATSP